MADIELEKMKSKGKKIQVIRTYRLETVPEFSSDENEIDVNSLFQGLDVTLTYDNLLIASNATNVKTLIFFLILLA